MAATDLDVKYVAHLARLSLSAEEEQKFYELAKGFMTMCLLKSPQWQPSTRSTSASTASVTVGRRLC